MLAGIRAKGRVTHHTSANARSPAMPPDATKTRLRGGIAGVVGARGRVIASRVTEGGGNVGGNVGGNDSSKGGDGGGRSEGDGRSGGGGGVRESEWWSCRRLRGRRRLRLLVPWPPASLPPQVTREVTTRPRAPTTPATPPRGIAAACPTRAAFLARPTTRETRAHTRSALMALAGAFGGLADDRTSALLLPVAMISPDVKSIPILSHAHGLVPPSVTAWQIGSY
ncbi:hypothetical protein FB107DRAFT_252416 [Schizophyllum commune]